jgi:hypothetical protein
MKQVRKRQTSKETSAHANTQIQDVRNMAYCILNQGRYIEYTYASTQVNTSIRRTSQTLLTLAGGEDPREETDGMVKSHTRTSPK